MRHWLNACWETSWEDTLLWGRLLLVLILGLAAVMGFVLGVCYLLTRHTIAWGSRL